MDIDLTRLEPYVLDPDRVKAATNVTMAGIVGERHTLDLEHLKDQRLSTVAFHIANYWVSEKLRKANEAPKIHLFTHAKRIVLQWLRSDRIVYKGGCQPAQLLYLQLADEVCELLMGALLDQPDEPPIIRATLDPFMSEGSTTDVNFQTSKAGRHTPRADRSHLNYIVTDSDWEAKFAQLLDEHLDVLAYTKNQNLGFGVPYSEQGEARTYLPDFLVRLRTPDGAEPLTLVVEIKGFRGHDAALKSETIRNKWIPAVNRLGTHGRWAFVELRSLHDFRDEFDAAIEAFIAEVEPA